MTTGEPLVVRVAMKPISTLMRPLGTVDVATGERGQRHGRAQRRHRRARDGRDRRGDAGARARRCHAGEVRRRLAARSPDGTSMATFRTSQPGSAADPAVPHLILVGLPGAGKSTVGAALARELGRPFLDFDAEIVRRQGMTIAEIFAQRGRAVLPASWSTGSPRSFASWAGWCSRPAAAGWRGRTPWPSSALPRA